MPLLRGNCLGYDFDRMIVEFTMFNRGNGVRCAISAAAMDDLEPHHRLHRLSDVGRQRLQQFERLRDRIERIASGKFFNGPVEADGSVLLRSEDFF
jgi:uncharacterized protein DUF1488